MHDPARRAARPLISLHVKREEPWELHIQAPDTPLKEQIMVHVALGVMRIQLNGCPEAFEDS